jgi:uncharacterized protein
VGNIRIFFVSDLHGSEICFRKFLNAAKAYEADVIISGGDMTGKMVVPLVQRDNGTFTARYQGSDIVMKSDEEVAAQEKLIRNNGFYPVRMTEQEMSSMDGAAVEELFAREMRKVVQSWMRLAEERLGNSKIECFMMPGNDDMFDVDEMLNGSSYVVNVDDKVVDLGSIQMISTGWANMTPWHCPRDVSEEELEERVEAMISKLRDPRKAIFNLHCPPYASTLDSAPLLDENLTPQLEIGGDMKMVPVGSKAIRKVIEKYQPCLSLHGHIHEGRGATKIGRTLAMNPGSEYQQGILRGAVIVVSDKGEVKDWAFTAG